MKGSLARLSFLLLLPLIWLSLGLTPKASGSQSFGEHSLYLSFITKPLSEQWIKNYAITGSTINTFFTDFELVANDELLLVGETSDGGDSNVFIMKTQSNGELLWYKGFSTDYHDNFHTIALANDGGYWVGGSAGVANSFVGYPWLLRLDASGNVLWQKKYTPPIPTPDGARIDKLVATADGGALLTINDFVNVWIVKLASDGSISWARYLGDNFYTYYLTEIQITPDGAYLLAGSAPWNGDYLAWVVKLSSDGSIVWQRIYGLTQATTSQSGHPFGLELMNDGTYLLGVRTRVLVQGHSEYAVWLLRLNENGGVVWQGAYDVPSYSSLTNNVTGMTSTHDGGIIVIGGDSPSSNRRPWIFKVNSNGTLAWQYYYGGVQGFNWPSVPYAVKTAGTGDIMVAGSEDYQNVDGLLLMRLTPEGTIPDCSLLVSTTVNTSTPGFFVETITSPEEISSIIVTDVNVPSWNLNVQSTTICPQSPAGAVCLE